MAHAVPMMNMNVFPPRSQTASSSLPEDGELVLTSSGREQQSHQRTENPGNHGDEDAGHLEDSPHEAPIAHQRGSNASENDNGTFGVRRRQPHQQAEEGDQMAAYHAHRGGMSGDTQQPVADEPSDHAHINSTSAAGNIIPASQEPPAWILKSKRWILEPVGRGLSLFWPVWAVVRAMPGALAVWLLLAFAERSTSVSINMCAFMHTNT
jgi:hypothetical protein